MVAIPVPAPDVNELLHAPLTIAHHESRHACIALALGLEVMRLSLESCHTRRRDDPNSRWARAGTVDVGKGSVARGRHSFWGVSR
jgi:hypothetical protein